MSVRRNFFFFVIKTEIIQRTQDCEPNLLNVCLVPSNAEVILYEIPNFGAQLVPE